MKKFIELYLNDYTEDPLTVLDVGSWNGRVYRSFITPHKQWKYIGLDIEPGDNVDVCVANPYDWKEVQTNSCDVVISGQAFEHIQFFWITFHEISRVLKDGGLACIIAPSTGGEHKFPFDCWRYYTDGFSALCQYVGFKQVEVFTDWGVKNWGDSFLVMQKPRLSPEDRDKFMCKNLAQRLALTGDLEQINDFKQFEFASEIHESIISEQSNRDVAYTAYKAEFTSHSSNPKPEEFYRRLSGEEMKRKEFDDAFKTLSEATTLFPDNKTFHQRFAYVHQELGNIDSAIAGFKTAIDLDPSDFISQKRLADLYHKVYRRHPKLQKADVIAAYEKAFSIKPDGKIKQLLDKLRSA